MNVLNQLKIVEIQKINNVLKATQDPYVNLVFMKNIIIVAVNFSVLNVIRIVLFSC